MAVFLLCLWFQVISPLYDLMSHRLLLIICDHFFTGYVQGMSDLLSPVLVVMENEVDAFWCFAGLMERMVSSFVFYTTFSLCVCVWDPSSQNES